MERRRRRRGKAGSNFRAEMGRKEEEKEEEDAFLLARGRLWGNPKMGGIRLPRFESIRDFL